MRKNKFRTLPYTTKDVAELRAKTPVGAFVKFAISNESRYYDSELRLRKQVKGCVAAKYKHVFVLDDGTHHTWVDYLIGRRMMYGK